MTNMELDNLVKACMNQANDGISSFAELEKLEALLKEAGIPFEKEEAYGGYHLGYPTLKEERTCSIILHDGSYGHQQGLLEIMGLLTPEEREYDEVVGYLTAVDVFERIQKDWESRQNS